MAQRAGSNQSCTHRLTPEVLPLVGPTRARARKTENPKFLKRAQRNLRRKQKALSRKQKGSKKRAKARLIVAKAHEKVANARKHRTVSARRDAPRCIAQRFGSGARSCKIVDAHLHAHRILPGIDLERTDDV